MAKKQSFNALDMLQDIVAKDFDYAQEQIDESEFPQAKNFLDWNLGREFCDATLLPWQIEANMHLFSDYCPDCSNPEYLTDLFDEAIEEIKDNVQFLEHGVCPKCHKNRLELFTVGEFGLKPSLKNELVANLGQRAGKSKEVVSSASYQLHRWMKLKNPIEYFGLPKMEVVLGTFSALSADQAEENLWMPFSGLYEEAPWFKKYNEFLRSEEKRLSIPLIDYKGTYLFYPHKRIMLSFTGSDDRKKRGRTRFFGAIDEIAFLNSDGKNKKVMDADKNYAALNNSLSTIRQKAVRMIARGDYNVPMPIMYNASSPYNVMDKIMRLTKESPAKNPWAVVIHRSTWEANPDYSEASCRSLNPNISEVEFMRDFGAVPPFSDSPYIGDSKFLEKLCVSNLPPVVDAKQEVITDPMGDKYFYLKTRLLRNDRMTPRLLALDNGHKQNAFGACLFRYDAMNKKPIVDFLVNLYPDPQNNITINFPLMFENFILPLLAGLRIVHVFYDRWQSLDQIQRLREMKVDARAHSLSYEKDMLPFKQQLLSGNMILPKCELPIIEVKDSSNPLQTLRNYPVASLIWQCLTVREAGKKLLKPLEGDDDLFRAFVLGGSRFMDQEVRKKYTGGFSGVQNAVQNRNGKVGTFHSARNPASSAASISSGSLPFARFKSRGK